MPIDQLKPGDILLFEGEGDTLDRTIEFLTNSRVTHAALYYHQGALADIGLGGTGLHAVKDDPAGRGIYVRRMSDDSLPMQPVLDTAKSYCGQADPYDKPGLALLTLLIVYKKFTPSFLAQSLIATFLKRVTTALDAKIAEILHSGKKPMVCSQFVYQCYQDVAAKDPRYDLPIQAGTYSVRQAPTHSLLHQVASHRRSATPMSAPAKLSLANRTISDDDLLSKLLDALQSEGSRSPAQELQDDLVDAVHAAGDLLHRCAHPTAPKAISGLQFLQQQEAFFVTPADLLTRCPRLVDKGSMKIDRDFADWVPPAA